MEIDFDKEIDALLRRDAALQSSPPYNGGVAEGRGGSPALEHLDADEISAFAENALPEKTRAVYMRHLADCDRCRRILSELITSGSAADVKAASSVVGAPSVASVAPWYRRIFLMPNLAYAMGGLVLIFAGLLGYSALQNSTGRQTAEVSQVAEERPAGGPNADEEPDFGMTNAVTANTAVNANIPVSRSAAGTTSTSANSAASAMPGAANLNASAATKPEPLALDGLAANTARSMSPEQPAAAAGVAPDRPSSAPIARPEPLDMKTSRDEAGKREEPTAKEDALLRAENERARSDAGELMKAAPSAKSVSGLRRAAPGPEQQMNNRQISNLPTAARQNQILAARRVGGKMFEQNQGVWYDTSYQGQKTINIRRGTGEYKKLDPGLRSIAQSFGGTLVVVWKEKAYRIQ